MAVLAGPGVDRPVGEHVQARDVSLVLREELLGAAVLADAPDASLAGLGPRRAARAGAPALGVGARDARRIGELVRADREHSVAHGERGDLVAREVVHDLRAARAGEPRDDRLIAGARVEGAVRVERQAHHVARGRVPPERGVALPIDGEDLPLGAGGREEHVARAVPGEIPHVLDAVGPRDLARLTVRADAVDAALGQGARVHVAARAERQRGHEQLPGLREELERLAAQPVDLPLVAGAQIDRPVGRAGRGVDERDVLGQRDPAQLGARRDAAVRVHRGAHELAGREGLRVVEHEALGRDGERVRRDDGAGGQHAGAAEGEGEAGSLHGLGVSRTRSCTRAVPVTTSPSSMAWRS